ncbi:Hypothetical protein, putative [Bodo saltans]|uniref:Uncharacterized protein n=1 Tax=Bodo saltans TaxID=75058 RepID=A0A0S4JDG2_BODSA|nr:Hypothetical protein, putative [Bodo saltans]|eukprot:CUG87241.1 Hypothetical protein, putative [Bodo saltans]
MTYPSTLFELDEEVRYLKLGVVAHKPGGLSDDTKSRNIMGALLLHFVETNLDAGSSTGAASLASTTNKRQQQQDGPTMSRVSSFASSAHLRSQGIRSPPPRGLPVPSHQQRGNSPTTSEASLRRHTSHKSTHHSRSSPTDTSLGNGSPSSSAADYFQPKAPINAVAGASVEEEATSTIDALDSLDEYLVQWRDETDRRKQRSLLLATASRATGVASGGGAGASSPGPGQRSVPGESVANVKAIPAGGGNGRRKQASFVGV